MRAKVALATLILCAACSDSNLGAPRKFFENEKIGSAPDFAIVKWGTIEDHVATVHGFVDDMKVCQQLADALNRDACAEIGGTDCRNPFSCQPLNH